MRRFRSLLLLAAVWLVIAPPVQAIEPRGPSEAELHSQPWDGPRFRALRECESRAGADSAPYDRRGDRYHGWYQFTLASWAGAGGWGDPHAWSLEEQTQRARWWWHHAQPADQWPSCYRRTNARSLPDRD